MQLFILIAFAVMLIDILLNLVLEKVNANQLILKIGGCNNMTMNGSWQTWHSGFFSCLTVELEDHHKMGCNYILK